MSFGTLLQHHRHAAGLTQRDLADRAGFSTVYVGMLERGERQAPAATVGLLVEALGLNAADSEALHASAGCPRCLPSPLAGRQSELARIERHLQARQEAGLLLAGEPGIGKTRLLDEAAARAASRFLVLQGASQRLLAPPPYEPILGALEQFISGRPPQARVRAALRGNPWLARLLPELAPLCPPELSALPDQDERRLTFHALADFLVEIAAPRGVLLLLDDLQWACADAFELLETVLRARRIAVIGAYRTNELRTAPALTAFLSGAGSRRLIATQAVGPLPAAASAELADRLLGGATEHVEPSRRQELLRRAGGVPFFLQSCAATLRAGSSELPWELCQSIRQRVSELSVLAQALLALVAIAGPGATTGLLRQASRLPEGQLSSAIAEASDAKLLRATREGYRFVHPVIGEVIEADLSQMRRGALRQRVAMAQRSTASPTA
ncbi:MAG: AAA family ATPase [bacterium]|nr:AAA family ATPase [bacterium]